MELISSIRENCAIIKNRDGAEPKECAEAEKIYSQTLANYRYGPVGSGSSGGSASSYVNTFGRYDRKGNFQSSTYVNGRQVGYTVIYAPSRKK
jgi:hypothetical protein